MLDDLVPSQSLQQVQNRSKQIKEAGGSRKNAARPKDSRYHTTLKRLSVQLVAVCSFSKFCKVVSIAYCTHQKLESCDKRFVTQNSIQGAEARELRSAKALRRKLSTLEGNVDQGYYFSSID